MGMELLKVLLNERLQLMNKGLLGWSLAGMRVIAEIWKFTETISLFGKLYFLGCTSVFLRACKVYFSDEGLVGSG